LSARHQGAVAWPLTIAHSRLCHLAFEPLAQLVPHLGDLLGVQIVSHRCLRRAWALFQNDRAREIAKDIFKDIQVNTSIYFGTLTVVNICLGFAATVLTWLVGLPHPFLWGMLAAVLNFIPYLGAAIVIATLFVVGVIVFPSLGQAVVAPLAYLGITALEGHFITPTLVGHRLTINPFLVFLSIACWAWMWGPVGAFLAVPILLCAMVAARRLTE
jgi:predicted PurR-regulated permease PerM